MVSLETSFLIDLLRGHDPARDMMETLDDDKVRPTVSPVVAAEVWVGAELGSAEEREITAALLDSLTWLPFTREAARRAGKIRAELTSDGQTIGITDAMIAAIAIDHDEPLVTRDEHFERITSLRVRTY